jgi:hypothetical protein
MTLWRRAPREVYRVYGEDEYLAEDEPIVGELAGTAGGDGDGRHFTIGRSRSPGSRSGRLIGLGLVVGVTLGVAGLVVRNVSDDTSSVPRLGAPQSTPRTPVAHSASIGMHAGSASVVRRSPGARSGVQGNNDLRGQVGSDLRAQVGERMGAQGRTGGIRTQASISHFTPSCHDLGVERSRESAPRAAQAFPQQSQTSTSESPRSQTTASSIANEFDFER